MRVGYRLTICRNPRERFCIGTVASCGFKQLNYGRDLPPLSVEDGST